MADRAPIVRRIRNWLGWHRGFGCCLRCRDSWAWATRHTTDYRDTRGCFPLCESCWQQLTPAERLPFYDQIVDVWIAQTPTDAPAYELDRQLIAAAVIAGA